MLFGKINFNKISFIFYYLLVLLIICFGLFLRIRLYLSGYEMYIDERSLHLNLFGYGFSQCFKSLVHCQMAPPLYLSSVKILTELFGHNFYVLRFLSILSGCLSLILFYPLLTKSFKSKISILVGLFLFAVNTQLIYYSNEFKPYAIDVLVIIILFWIYDKIDFGNNKSMILWLFLFFIIPFFSFTSLIALGAICILKTLELFLNKDKTIKQKFIQFCKLLIGIFIIFVSAYILFKINEGNKQGMIDWHNKYFLELSFSSLYNLVSQFLNYVFTGFLEQQNPNVYIQVIILCFSIFAVFFNKNKIMYLSVISLFLALFSSFIKIYPFFERMNLYLIPICILFVISIMDKQLNVDKYNIHFYKSLILIILLFFSIDIENNLQFVVDGGRSIVQHITYKTRYNENDEALKFLKMYNPGEKYIISDGGFYYWVIDYNNIIKRYNYKLDLDEEIINIKVQNDINKDEKLKILTNKIEKELNGNKKINYWISGYINSAEEAAQENFVEDIMDRMKLKYKTYETLNGNLYYIER